MNSAGAIVVASFAAVVLLVRVSTLLRRHAANRAVAHPVGPDGIVIGAEPLRLVGTGERGMLLLHGFNDTPQSVSQMAHALHERGWSVCVPLLPQHGRGSTILATTGDGLAWIAGARDEWNALRTRVPCAVLAGQLMGGAIAVILAAEKPPAALVLLAPYLSMGRLTRWLAMVWPVWQVFVPRLSSDPRRGLHDSSARDQALGGGWFTPRLVRELNRVVETARAALLRIDVPTLVIHARTDYRIPSRSAAEAFGRIATADKTLVWRENTGHVLAADLGREGVYEIVGDWLESKVKAT